MKAMHIRCVFLSRRATRLFFCCWNKYFAFRLNRLRCQITVHDFIDSIIADQQKKVHERARKKSDSTEDNGARDDSKSDEESTQPDGAQDKTSTLNGNLI